MTPLVEFRDVRYSAGGKPILRGLNLAVQQNETLVLLGRSGSGKTTALKLINALLMPVSGEVRVAGQATSTWDPVRLRRRIGYVIQEIGLFPHWTVGANVGTVPRLEGWPPERIEGRTRELLELLHLPPDEYGARFPHQLSGGQKQRVGVARALAADPDLLLFDEPFGALDPVTRTGVQREFRALAASLGKTAVFVTHDVREALLLATRIALLCDGTLEVLETPEGFRASTHPEARAFLECLA